jgi:hypothetical protein
MTLQEFVANAAHALDPLSVVKSLLEFSLALLGTKVLV